LSIIYWASLPTWLIKAVHNISAYQWAFWEIKLLLNLTLEWLYEEWWFIIIGLFIFSLFGLIFYPGLIYRTLSQEKIFVICCIIVIATLVWITPRIQQIEKTFNNEYIQIERDREYEDLSNRIQQTTEESNERLEEKARIEREENTKRCTDLYWKWYYYFMDINENLDIERFCLNDNNAWDKKAFK